MTEINTDKSIDVIEREKTKNKKPSNYKVMLHNDDYSHPIMVTSIIMSVFHKSEAEGLAIMHEAHTKGRAICGIYPKDSAETKVSDAMTMAKMNGAALLLTTEKE